MVGPKRKEKKRWVLLCSFKKKKINREEGEGEKSKIRLYNPRGIFVDLFVSIWESIFLLKVYIRL